MSQINRLILWGLGILLAALIGWYLLWFYQNFERHYRDTRVDISPAAQRNQLLAAERFLETLGYRAESVQGRDLITKLPPVGDTLFLRQLPTDMDDQALYTLNDWIEAGGRLIVMPASIADDEGSGERFLDDLGVYLLSFEYDDSDKNERHDIAEEPADSTVQEEDSVERLYVDRIEMTLPGDSESVTATFRKGYALEDRDSWASFSAGDDYGSRLLVFEIGLGRVAVISDLRLFTNDRIGFEDNAYLLRKLVEGSNTVWLQYSIDMPGLPSLLWQKFPLVVSLALGLLALMGWRLFLYTGPPRTLDNSARRNLLEHIDASAAYAWRIDKGQKMLEDNRTALEQAWRRRHPVLNSMTQEQRSDWLAEKTGMAASAISRTLYGDIDKELDFIKATLVMQQLTSGLQKRELR
ncbi:MAG: DUF4350 domain-containing protein [Amphritea sp.]|nr:DUF4350 domain-containing protein [Amphritea sp.]